MCRCRNENLIEKICNVKNTTHFCTYNVNIKVTTVPCPHFMKLLKNTTNINLLAKMKTLKQLDTALIAYKLKHGSAYN